MVSFARHLSFAAIVLVAAATGANAESATGALDGRAVQTRFAVYAEPLFPPATVFRLPPTPSRGGKLLAFADGRIRKVTETAIEIDVLSYENHRRMFYVFRYSGIRSPAVKVGDIVKRRDLLALSFSPRLQAWRREAKALERAFVGDVDEMEEIPNAKKFVAAKRRSFDPSQETQLILIDKDDYALQVREDGVVVVELDIGYGQAKGRKRVQGDLKTPTGMYFVVDKKRKEFGGKWGEYFGGHWIKINYPNAYDAEWGVENGHLSVATQKSIARAWRKRTLTNQRTKLGGGIGFHGWIGTRTTRDDWSADDPHQTWGCILLHNVDIGAHFDRVRDKAMVVAFGRE